MLALLKEALSVWIIRTRIDTLNQACYAAAGYAQERRLKKGGMSDAEFDQCMIEYLQLVLPGIKDADKHIDAVKARLLGVGADPEQSIRNGR